MLVEAGVAQIWVVVPVPEQVAAPEGVAELLLENRTVPLFNPRALTMAAQAPKESCKDQSSKWGRIPSPRRSPAVTGNSLKAVEGCKTGSG